jgi:uncharacterized protein
MDTKRRMFLKYAGLTSLGGVVMSSSSVLYATTIEPDWLDVATVPMHLARLDPAFHGYRIVQLSDIHADNTWMDAQRLSHIVEVANAQNPDLVVITGDFVTYIHDRMQDTLSTLHALRARDGVFAVLGNHDYRSDATLVRTLLHSYGVQELKNRVHTLSRGKAMLHLVGMDDLWEQTNHYHIALHSQKDVLASLLEPLPGLGAVILLVHEPDFADLAASTGRVDLQLSGHSHGGQIRLPGYGALRLPRLGKKYQAGLYHINTMLHYTNRGLGMMDFQVRFNCRPEITTFVL